ncbi:MAG: hypothetical protein Q9179_005159, partial [Wetmoreana sp. 5 TL-2023]
MGGTVAWQRDGVAPLIDGIGFDSEIFTLTVGPEAKIMKVHAAYLCQSPVLERMCNARFKESQTKQIALPDDDPKVVTAIIQYLYGGDFCNIGTDNLIRGTFGAASVARGTLDEPAGNAAGTVIEAADELAEVYVTVEKYQLQDLKVLLVKKFESITDVKSRPNSFLYAARKVYAGIPDSEDAYRTFFKNTAIQLNNPDRMNKSVRKAFDDCMSFGGILAVDLAAALCSKLNGHFAEARLEENRRVAVLEKKQRDTNSALDIYKDWHLS